MSILRDWVAAQTTELQTVDRQRIYLRNPLPPGDGICAVCRSSAGEDFELCYQCSQHRMAARDQLADVVAPVSYAIKRTQHAHSLAVYKATPHSDQAIRDLSSLGVLFIAYHWECLTRVLGGPLTHIVTVPSTRARLGPHPIDTAVADRIGLTPLKPVVNPAYTADDRGFHADRFALPPHSAAGGRVLLVDDTWTTGSRAQSLAYAVKGAGALGVAAVVLGRHVNPDYGPSKALVERLRAAPWFDLHHCVLDDLKGKSRN